MMFIVRFQVKSSNFRANLIWINSFLQNELTLSTLSFWKWHGNEANLMKILEIEEIFLKTADFFPKYEKKQWLYNFATNRNGRAKKTKSLFTVFLNLYNYLPVGLLRLKFVCEVNRFRWTFFIVAHLCLKRPMHKLWLHDTIGRIWNSHIFFNVKYFLNELMMKNK